jgi:hypothetical protein
MSAFAPLLGDKRTSILPHLTARSARHSRSPREPDPACPRNFHDPWRRPDTDVAAEDDAAVVAMA